MEAILTKCMLLLTFAHVCQITGRKVPSLLIHGGDKINITDAPFMALFKNVDQLTVCGAAIIHRKMLLSAAHCHSSEGRSFVLVGTGIYTPRKLRGQQFEIKEVVNHHGSTGDAEDDICVIVLIGTLKFSFLVKPVPMADASLMPKAGELMEIHGFGITEFGRSRYLRIAELPFVETSECEKLWRKEIPENSLCAGGEKGINACDGDSGGPVVFQDRLFGIISAAVSDPCAEESYPMLMTHISSMRGFIDNVMINNPDTQCAFEVRGGSHVNITAAPYVASFKLEDKRFTCAATIIHVQFLVTTAHCLQGLALMKGNLTITVGSDTNDYGDTYKAEKYFIHPDFDADTYDYDLAVIKLQEKLKRGNGVRKVNMAEATVPTPGSLVDVYGFTGKKYSGESSLHKLSLPYYDWRSCKNLYARNTHFPITHQMLCAGEVGKEEACAGYNGGPVIYENSLFGIISWGKESCWRQFPSVLTNIPFLRLYIQDVIKNNYIE